MGNEPSTESITDPTTTMMPTTYEATTWTYPPLTEEEIADIKKSMSPIDKDGDGIITNEEVETFMIIHADNSTEYISEAEIKDMTDRFDMNGNGISDFHDFVRYRYLHEPFFRDIVREAKNDYAEYKQRFSQHDLDGDGTLTFDELSEVNETDSYNFYWNPFNIFWGSPEKFIPNATEADLIEAQDAFRVRFPEMDIDGDGRINYEEFFPLIAAPWPKNKIGG